MKITRLLEIPKGYDWGKSSELADYEIAKLEELGIEEARYWYAQGDYEGSGQLLMLKGGKWYHHDMGHCSCYGPTERIELKTGYATLEELLATCTEELRGYLQPLVQNVPDQRPGDNDQNTL